MPLGWMGVCLGVGWIAYALHRHVHPASPFLMLSPAGISCQAVYRGVNFAVATNLWPRLWGKPTALGLT